MEEGKKKAEGSFSPISSSSTPVLWKSRKRSGTCLLCCSPTHLISSPFFFRIICIIFNLLLLHSLGEFLQFKYIFLSC